MIVSAEFFLSFFFFFFFPFLLVDTIVYLRMLEGAKLAPVYERKRKQLMDQLLDLQGDTRREAPPKLDSDDDEDEDVAAPQDSPVKRRETSGRKGSGEDRDSKVSDRLSKFEKPSAGSGGRNFKYKTLEELKKGNSVSLDGDKPEEEKEKEKAENSPATPTQSTAKDPANDPPSNSQLKDSLEVKDDNKSSSLSNTPTGTPDSKRKSLFAGGLFKKKIKHDSKERAHSLGGGSSADNVSIEEKPGSSLELNEDEDLPTSTASTDKPTEQEQQPTKEEVEEIEEEKEEESDKPLTSLLERVTKRLGRYSYQKVELTLLSESVKFRKPNQSVDKSTEVSLLGAASAIRDSYQFELHTPDKSYTFRTDSEELCTKWVTALGEAIDYLNPIEELAEEEEEEGQGAEPDTSNKGQ